MKVVIYIVLFVSALAIGSAWWYIKYRVQSLTDQHRLEDSVDLQVDTLFKTIDSHGLVVGIYKNNKTFVKGYGVKKKLESVTPDGNTVFQIASVSKIFTSALLQQLHNKEVVALDSTIGELIGDSIGLTDTASKITLRQLATHTSGLPRIPKSLMTLAENRAGDDDIMVDPYSYVDVDEIFNYLATADDIKAPGDFVYSNYGMGLLGHILERVTGSTLEELLNSELLEPLDMRDTGLTGLSVPSEIQQQKAQGYTDKGVEAPFWRFAAVGGAGGMYSTANDMMKFITASLQPNHFANHLLTQMQQPQFKGQTGIGWMQPGFMDKLVGNGDWIWHNGQVGGYVSYLAIDTVNKLGVVILSAKSVDASVAGMVIVRQVRSQSWAN